MDKENVIYKHTHTHTHTVEYYSSITKNETLPSETTEMDFKGFMLNEIS